jgi:hypothetical protein
MYGRESKPEREGREETESARSAGKSVNSTTSSMSENGMNGFTTMCFGLGGFPAIQDTVPSASVMEESKTRGTLGSMSRLPARRATKVSVSFGDLRLKHLRLRRCQDLNHPRPDDLHVASSH